MPLAAAALNETARPPPLFLAPLVLTGAAAGLLPVLAEAEEALATPALTGTWVGFAALTLFALAYLAVLSEEFTGLRKSKPVMLAAGVIWTLIAAALPEQGRAATHEALAETLLEYAELMLFLLAAMTYVNSLTERNVFEALRAWLIRRGFGFRKLFWIVGWLAFFISPVIDNLTTALVLCAVALALGAGNPRFVSLCCINIVVAANAGGAFSPFGDITTLMVWQRGHVAFEQFFALFVPSVVNFVVPAALMHFAVPRGRPAPLAHETVLKRGALVMIGLFGLTLATAVSVHNFLDLPPYLGMMSGLAYLKFFGYYLRVSNGGSAQHTAHGAPADDDTFDIYRHVAAVEWDTLLFFYGVILCVGGLSYIGYLEIASTLMYGGWGATWANVGVGVASAIVDNIPIMVAVLHMEPQMPLGQWLLVTLTAGVGGSMLSIGSAAGVALMGQARGLYTFFRHLRWTPAIALGFAASVATHRWLNAALF